MLKLYYNPRSRARMAKWMLDECGADYELIHTELENNVHRTPEFLALNPAGKIPLLVDGAQRIYETSAIGLYLGDIYPELAPPLDSPLRGKYLTLMVYATSQLEPAMGDALLKQETSPYRGWTNFAQTQQVIAQELGDSPYLLGDDFSLVDIMIGSQFIWKRMFGAGDELPAIEDYVNRLMERPLNCLKDSDSV